MEPKTENKKELLIAEDRLLELLEKTNDQAYLESLTDQELKYLYEEADILYLLFNNIQMGTKRLCNSIYGGLGTSSLRYYNMAVADDITAEGREACKLTDKMANAYFHNKWHTDTEWHKELMEKFPSFFPNGLSINKIPDNLDLIIYDDTDSNYVAFDYVFESMGLDPYVLPTKETTEFIVYFMQKKMDPMYDNLLNSYINGRNGKNTMIFELEAVGGFGIWAAKKKYVFSKLWEDGKYIADKGKLKVVGLEIRQKAASKRVKKILETYVNTIFARRGKIDSMTFFSMCKSVKASLHDATIEELSKATKLNNYHKYVVSESDTHIEFAPKTPVTVRGAARYNQLIRLNKLEGEYPILKDDMFVKIYYDVNGDIFTYPADYGVPPIAPEISIDIQLEKLVFNPVKKLVEGLIDGDLNTMGQDKVQTGFSALMNKFKKK